MDRSAWYASLKKPWFTPPASIFGPVWAVLYLLMGGAALLVVFEGGPHAPPALIAFGVQVVINLLWPMVFWRRRSLAGSVGVILLLWVAVLATIVLFSRVSGLAAVLLIPYLLWVTLAAFLSGAIWRLNPAPSG
ncbi:TspO/MBR family protein [Methanofollis sp. W23]|uniref:TspO/MBR family protein n=1 Tax=Methanofollis sp. W23 TaxID=2817849 RepID=UPI001AEA07B8|nr:TspO/MBR family protein [Methanofollis sp. W23]